MTRRRLFLLEVLGRVLAVCAAVYVLPSVFATDVGHFRGQATCLWKPTGKALGMCVNRHLLVSGGAGGEINLPFRHLVWEFPPLPLVTLPLTAPFWGRLEVSQLLFGLAMAGVELAALVRLRRAWPEQRAALTGWWTATVAPVALIGWFRFDFLPVLFATIALVALVEGRRATGSIVAGWLSKLWPAVLVAGFVVERRWRDAARAVAGVAVATALWWAWSPSGFRTFLEFRAGKGLEVESFLGAVRLVVSGSKAQVVSGAWAVDAGGFGWFNSAMAVGLVAFALLCIWRAWRPGADVVALCGALTVATMVFSRIISAQYVVWMAPFVVVLAARGNRRLGVLSLGAGWFTFAYLLVFDNYVVPGNRLAGSLMIVRNAFLLAILIELFVAIRPRPSVDSNNRSLAVDGASLG